MMLLVREIERHAFLRPRSTDRHDLLCRAFAAHCVGGLLLRTNSERVLIRSRDANLYALANLDANWFTDRIGLLSTQSKKQSQTVTLGLGGEARDDFGGGGWTSEPGGLRSSNRNSDWRGYQRFGLRCVTCCLREK